MQLGSILLNHFGHFNTLNYGLDKQLTSCLNYLRILSTIFKCDSCRLDMLRKFYELNKWINLQNFSEGHTKNCT